MKAMKLAVAQRDGLRNIAITLVDPLVSEAGTPSGCCRERSLRAYDGVVNVVGNPNPVVSGFPKPSPIRWFERVSAATSFYAAFLCNPTSSSCLILSLTPHLQTTS